MVYAYAYFMQVCIFFLTIAEFYVFAHFYDFLCIKQVGFLLLYIHKQKGRVQLSLGLDATAIEECHVFFRSHNHIKLLITNCDILPLYWYTSGAWRYSSFYKHLCHKVSHSNFFSKYSKSHNSQTVRARELNIRDNLHQAILSVMSGLNWPLPSPPLLSFNVSIYLHLPFCQPMSAFALTLTPFVSQYQKFWTPLPLCCWHYFWTALNCIFFHTHFFSLSYVEFIYLHT